MKLNNIIAARIVGAMGYKGWSQRILVTSSASRSRPSSRTSAGFAFSIDPYSELLGTE